MPLYSSIAQVRRQGQWHGPAVWTMGQVNGPGERERQALPIVMSLSTLLQQRATLAREIRSFFDDRGVLEASTPLLSRAAVTDPAIESVAVTIDHDHTRYLRTSPEFALKRLLSAGAPDLYELGPVFRNGESGRWHNPEFTLLEWYRRGFDMQGLIDEVVELLQTVRGGKLSRHTVRQVRYYRLFQETLGCEVSALAGDELAQIARERTDVPDGSMDTDQWLDFLFGTQVQPRMTDQGIVIVTHYPASQAALARIDPDAPDTALRFEVFVDGIELANGFEELNDSRQQAQRFSEDNALRKVRGQREMPVDGRFLESLDRLPACSGVALGFDRLLMRVDELPSISDALAFPWDEA